MKVNFKKLQEMMALRESPIHHEQIPAAMLVLKRVGIRSFPDGRKVALYTNDKYNLLFSVPYGSNIGASGTQEPIIAGQVS